MLVYSVIVSMLLTTGTAHTLIDTDVCTPATVPVPPPPPDLSAHYSAHVEWKEVLTNKTYTVHELYDKKNQMGKMVIRSPFQSDVTVIFNYRVDEIYVLKGGNCETKEVYHYEDKQWLTPLISIYNTIMRTKAAVFSGHTVLREYPVSHWKTCTFQSLENITTQLDIYYSDIGWILPDTPPNRPIPIRIEMRGKQHGVNVTEFHVIGDITEFTVFSTFNEDTFMTPPGMYCPGRANIKGLPILGETFSMVMEIIDMDFHHVTFQQLWYDGKKRMIRYETKLAHGDDPDPESTVLDFNTGHRYTTDTYTGSCNIQKIRVGDEFVRIDENKLYMQSSAQYFHLKTQAVQYVGQRRTRGIMCDVWVGVFYDIDAARNMTIEWYFTTSPWMEAVDTLMVSADFVRMDIWKGIHPTILNIVKYSPVDQKWSAFDFGNCFVPQSKLHFIIYFEILEKANFLKVSQEYMKMKLIEELSTKILLEPNRLSNVMFDYDGDTKIFISATLLDQPPTVNNDMAVRIKTKPLYIAYNFIKGNVEGNMLLLLKDTSGVPVQLRSEKILQISYPAEFATTTTLSTTSSPLRIPTLPHVTNATEKTPAPPMLGTTTMNKTHGLKTSMATTLRDRTSTTVTSKRHNSEFRTTKLRHRTSTSTTRKRQQSEFTMLMKPNSRSNDSTRKGEIAGAVIGGLLMGIIVCFVTLVVISRFRYIPWLNSKQEDTEMIPLGNY